MVDLEAIEADARCGRELTAADTLEMIAEIRRLRDYAQQVAEWEAELILSQEAWGGGTREFPQFTAAIFDRWLELQAQRNAALQKGGAP